LKLATQELNVASLTNNRRANVDLRPSKLKYTNALRINILNFVLEEQQPCALLSVSALKVRGQGQRSRANMPPVI